jgi:D-2-hydroxyacid dehydrogenase (NADP+)
MNIVIVSYAHPQLKHITAYGSEHIGQIHGVLPNATVRVVAANEPAFTEYVMEADILIMSPLDHRNLIDFSKLPKLKWVHITAAGATDTAARLQDSNIILTNSSGVHPIPIAEHVLGFMLMFSRQLTTSYAVQLNKKQWDQENIVSSLAELYKSRIGIIGFGRIGQRIAHLAKGFDMQTFALRHSDKQLPTEDVDKFYDEEDLAELLHVSDFVINCLPLTDKTADYFDRNKFAAMHKRAYFINIGRGGTVVEKDLIDALKQGTIAGAGLDVFREEPLPPTNELWKLKNVILTPHYAGWTPRYIDRVINIFCANFAAFLSGQPMPNAVDKSKGY